MMTVSLLRHSSNCGRWQSRKAAPTEVCHQTAAEDRRDMLWQTLPNTACVCVCFAVLQSLIHYTWPNQRGLLWTVASSYCPVVLCIVLFHTSRFSIKWSWGLNPPSTSCTHIYCRLSLSLYGVCRLKNAKYLVDSFPAIVFVYSNTFLLFNYILLLTLIACSSVLFPKPW